MLSIKKLLNKLKKKSKPLWVTGSLESMLPQQFDSIPEQITVSTSTTSSPLVNSYIQYGENKLTVTDDERIEKKPIDIVNEVISELPRMNMTDLQRQIKSVKTRLTTLKRLRANISNEEIALNYLKARLKFLKYAKYFNWKTTNDTLIKDLCKKYKVQLVNFGGYARNVPAEAIEQIEKYIKAWQLIISDYEPVFELIIDSGGKEQKKDPILLAKSPFGNWYYVLGAWDKEVEIIDDIIYNGK